MACAVVPQAYASGKNYVVNGSFEQPGYEQSVPDGYTWAPWNEQNDLSVLPGWDLTSGGIWNGAIALDAYDDGNHYLHFVGMDENGWRDMMIGQSVSGLTPGKTYELSFRAGVNFPEGSTYTPDPEFGYRLYANYDTENSRGTLFQKENFAETRTYDVSFVTYKAAFTAPADGKVYLEIYQANNYYEGNFKRYLWMNLDDVAIYDPEETGEPLVPYIVGDFNGWLPESPMSFEPTEDGNWMIQMETGGFKISTTPGDWDTFNRGALSVEGGYVTREAVGTPLPLINSETNIELPWSGEWIIALDSQLSTITCTALSEPPAGYVQAYIMGAMNGWMAEDKWQMSTNDGITYTFVCEGETAIAANTEFKIGTPTWTDINYTVGGMAFTDGDVNYATYNSYEGNTWFAEDFEGEIRLVLVNGVREEAELYFTLKEDLPDTPNIPQDFKGVNLTPAAYQFNTYDKPFIGFTCTDLDIYNWNLAVYHIKDFLYEGGEIGDGYIPVSAPTFCGTKNQENVDLLNQASGIIDLGGEIGKVLAINYQGSGFAEEYHSLTGNELPLGEAPAAYTLPFFVFDPVTLEAYAGLDKNMPLRVRIECNVFSQEWVEGDAFRAYVMDDQNNVRPGGGDDNEAPDIMVNPAEFKDGSSWNPNKWLVYEWDIDLADIEEFIPFGWVPKLKMEIQNPEGCAILFRNIQLYAPEDTDRERIYKRRLRTWNTYTVGNVEKPVDPIDPDIPVGPDADGNYVYNGSFENPAYEQAVPSAFTWDPWDKIENLTYLPGWSLKTNIWNVLATVMEGNGDGYGYLDGPGAGEKYLRLLGYNDLGWTTGEISQVVKGLTPGKTYRLYFLSGAHFPEGEVWTPEPDYGYGIYDVASDEDGTPVAGSEIISENLAATSGWDLDYQSFVREFVAPESGEVFLRFYIDNQYGDHNKHDYLFVLFDDIRIYDPEVTEDPKPVDPEDPDPSDDSYVNFVAHVVEVGDHIRLLAEVLPETAEDKSLEWTTTDENVAAVDSTGYVSFVGAGNVDIVAWHNGSGALIRFVVEAVAATGLDVFPAQAYGASGQSLYLLALHTPTNTTDKNVTWFSDNESVATVDDEGRVTMIGDGIASIFAMSGDHQAVCEVHVGETTNVTAVGSTGITIEVTETGVVLGNLPELARVIVSAVDGKVVTAAVAMESTMTLDLMPGIYIVQAGDVTAKVLVK